MRLSRVMKKCEDFILCAIKHDWAIELRMPFGWSRVHCARCHTETGAPYTKDDLYGKNFDEIRRLGIRITGGG